MMRNHHEHWNYGNKVIDAPYISLEEEYVDQHRKEFPYPILKTNSIPMIVMISMATMNKIITKELDLLQICDVKVVVVAAIAKVTDCGSCNGS